MRQNNSVTKEYQGATPPLKSKAGECATATYIAMYKTKDN